ncbi:MAG TPA: hypothetical protein DF383_02490 [Deltaproteobacteria bacterium]|nr:hypothetical protein [Deltaproteobacteria bacterium]
MAKMGFAKQEIKGLLLSFWRFFWKTMLISGVVFAVWLAIHIWTSAPAPGAYQQPESILAYIRDGLILFGFSLFYVWPLGILGGLIGVCWRLFGAWTLFPVLVFPLVLWGLFGISGDFLSRQGLDIFEALRLAYQTHGMPELREAASGARIAHAGGPAAVILLIILLPPLLMDSLRLILDPGVLRQLAEFSLSLALIGFIGLLVSALISSIPLLRAFWKRLKARREAYRHAPIFHEKPTSLDEK